MTLEIVTDGTTDGTHVRDAHTKEPLGAVLSVGRRGDAGTAELVAVVGDLAATAPPRPKNKK